MAHGHRDGVNEKFSLAEITVVDCFEFDRTTRLVNDVGFCRITHLFTSIADAEMEQVRRCKKYDRKMEILFFHFQPEKRGCLRAL